MIRQRLYVVILISWPKKPFITASFPRSFSAFKSNDPEPHAGSYTLFMVVFPTVPSLVRRTDTSAGVKNSPPDLPAFEAYMVMRYSYASPKASIS